jgi:hypothetical protein
MMTLVRYPIAQRLFGGWSMALNKLSSLPAEERASCVALMNLKLPKASPGESRAAITLLTRFRETMA